MRVAVTAVVCGVVAGVGGWFAGSAAVPPPRTLTETVTRTPKPKREILIGASLPLSGKLAAVGRDFKVAYEYAVSVFNEKGGIYIEEYRQRLPIKLILYDNRTEPTTTVSDYEKLATVDKVDAFIGSAGGFLVVPSLLVAEKYKIPMVTSGVSVEEIYEKGYKYMFVTWPRPKAFAKHEATFWKELGVKKVMGWWEDTESGVTLEKACKETLPLFNIEFQTFRFAPGTKDFTDLILKAKEFDPDILASICSISDAITYIRQCKEYGWRPKLFHIRRGSESKDFAEILGEDSNYVTHNSYWSPKLPLPGIKEFIEYYKAKVGKEPPPGYCAMAGCAAYTLLSAIENARSLDKEKIREALTKIDVMTFAGRVRFNPDGSMVDPLILMMEWQHGKLEVVWPPEYATAKVMYPAPPWK